MQNLFLFALRYRSEVPATLPHPIPKQASIHISWLVESSHMFNSIKEWGRYGVFGVRGFNV
jgi:hypothetical protein